MSTLRISDAPLLPDVDGTEKIPTGGRGDYAISVDQIKGHIFQDIGKELVGLGNVDNTSDLDKPVSTAQQAALNLKADKTYVDTNLDLKADKTNVYTRTETTFALSNKADLVSGVIPESQIPSSFNDVLEFTTLNLPLIGESGKIYVTTDTNKTWRWGGNKYVEISGWNPDSVSKIATLPTYYTKEAGVDPITGVADGAYFNVHSSSDDTVAIEYQNVGGSAVATGKGYPSSLVVQGIVSKQIKHDKAFPSVLDHAEVVGDGLVNEQPSLQQYFRDADDNRKSSIFFPLRSHNYLIDTPLVVQEPLMIYGDAGPTYNRGIGKDGKIIVGGDCAIDVGNYRISSQTQDVDAKKSKNPADNWVFEKLAFVQKTGSTPLTKTVFKQTSKNNGPDRGLSMIGISATGFDNVLNVVDNSLQVQLATVVIERCCISNNKLAINYEGRGYGFRFVGNQCEQNTVGAIKLKGAGGITITDNMLEGQPTPIDIVGEGNQEGSYVEVKRNYFERNWGEYLIRFKDVSYGKGTIELANNIIADLGMKPDGSVESTDFCQILNNDYGYGYTVINKEPFPVTLMDNVNILPDSVLYGRRSQGFIQKGFRGDQGSKVYTDNFINILPDTTYLPMTTRGSTAETFVQTPFGSIVCPLNTDYFACNIDALAGDVISMNILFKSEFTLDLNDALFITISNTSILTKLELASPVISQDVNRKYILGTFTFKCPEDLPIILVKVRNYEQPTAVQMLAGCYKNFGQFTQPLKLLQVMPVVNQQQTKRFDVVGETIAVGAEKVVSFTFDGASLSDIVQWSYSASTGLISVQVYVSASNSIVARFKNTSADTFVLPTGSLKVKLLKG